MTVALHSHGTALGLDRPILGRIATGPVEPPLRGDHVRLLETAACWEDLAGYAAIATADAWSGPPAAPVVHQLRQTAHLVAGDIVRIAPNGHVRTLYRVDSPHNALFATDRCNSYCLMCSQPPRPHDDDRTAELLRLLDLIAPAPATLGITGGEPTLLKRGLLEVLRHAQERLPNTALHVLTNGRLFYYGAFARDLGAIGHPDLMLGVPLYSDLDYRHDHVVQAHGAFAQTMVGLQNLGRYGVPVEIRIVVHRHTVDRLPQLATFVYRNLAFAAQVVFMGLEMMGFAVPNQAELWAEPLDYGSQLSEAVHYLASRGMRVGVYNHPLCVLPQDLWPYAKRSISDWKNEYLPMCEHCSVQSACGGFFSSNQRRRVPLGLHPIVGVPASPPAPREGSCLLAAEETPSLPPHKRQPDSLGG